MACDKTNYVFSRMFPRLHLRTTSKLFAILLALLTSELLKRVLMNSHKEMARREPILKELRMQKNEYFIPVIGILTQAIDIDIALVQKKSMSARFMKYGNSYIPTSYVRFVETSGNGELFLAISKLIFYNKFDCCMI